MADKEQLAAALEDMETFVEQQVEDARATVSFGSHIDAILKSVTHRSLHTNRMRMCWKIALLRSLRNWRQFRLLAEC